MSTGLEPVRSATHSHIIGLFLGPVSGQYHCSHAWVAREYLHALVRGVDGTMFANIAVTTRGLRVMHFPSLWGTHEAT